MSHTVTNFADLMLARPAPAPFYEVNPRPAGGWHLRCVDVHGVEVKGGVFATGSSDLDYLDAIEEGEAFLLQASPAPAPTFWAHLYVQGVPRSFLCKDEAEFLDVADLLDACTIELYEDGSMVLRHCAPLPDVAPGVYPLPLAA